MSQNDGYNGKTKQQHQKLIDEFIKFCNICRSHKESFRRKLCLSKEFEKLNSQDKLSPQYWSNIKLTKWLHWSSLNSKLLKKHTYAMQLTTITIHPPHHNDQGPRSARNDLTGALLVYRPTEYSIRITGIDHRPRNNNHTNKKWSPPIKTTWYLT